MSYDIYFLNRRPDQSWDEALEELEEDQDVEVEGLVLPELIEAWDRIVPRARGLLGEIELFENGETCELTHHATGIQASVFSLHRRSSDHGSVLAHGRRGGTHSGLGVRTGGDDRTRDRHGRLRPTGGAPGL